MTGGELSDGSRTAKPSQEADTKGTKSPCMIWGMGDKMGTRERDFRQILTFNIFLYIPSTC